MHVIWESIKTPRLKRSTGIKIAKGLTNVGGDLVLAAKILKEVISFALTEKTSHYSAVRYYITHIINYLYK